LNLGSDHCRRGRHRRAVLQSAVQPRSCSRGRRRRETDGDPGTATHRRRSAGHVGRRAPDDATGTLLDLVVGNSGPTIAQNVQIKI